MFRTLSLAALTLVLCVTSAAAKDVIVTIKSFHFMAMDLNISAGDSVTWKNLDEEPHTVTGEQLHSGGIDTGGTFTFKFVKPGTYRYRCSIHPQMTGTITVT